MPPRFSTDVGRFGGARQQVALGGALQESAIRLSGIVLKAKQEADNLRVTDALNQLKRKANGLRFNTDDGYELLKEGDALASEDGKSLIDVYSGKLDSVKSEIENSLSNAEQKRLFNEHSIPVSTGFQGTLTKYHHSQFVEFNRRVNIETRDLARQSASENFDNDEALGNSIEAGARSVRNLTKSEAAVKQFKSNFHANVIITALNNKNIARAGSYYKKHQEKGLVGNDKIKMNAAIKEYSDVAKANSVSTITIAKYRTAFVQDDAENFVRVVNPDTPENTDRLVELMGKYPTLDKTLAAYHTSDKVVDKAIKEAEKSFGPRVDVSEAQKNWFNHLPKKTQEFVSAKINAFKSGQGTRPKPSLKEFIDSAISEAGPDTAQSTIEAIRKAATRDYKLVEGDSAQRADNILDKTQRILNENNGDMGALPASVRRELANYPEALIKAQIYANAIAKGNEAKTDDKFFTDIRIDPTILTGMSDTAANQTIMTNLAPKDRGAAIKMRTDGLTGKSSSSPNTIDHTGIANAITNLLIRMGVDPTDEDEAERIADITRFVEEDAYRIQDVLKRRMSPEEQSKRIDDLTIALAPSFQTPWFDFNKIELERLFDITFEEIPADLLPRIKLKLEAQGNIQPNESDMLVVYWHMQAAKIRDTR